MENLTIGLWRNKAPNKPLKKGIKSYPVERIFPSGRQALSYSIEKMDLGRTNRVAIPEWSSHCVISSVGRYASPIPMNEVVNFKINVDAVLLYEQWGWPIRSQLKSKLLEKFKDTTIILDRVDSADLHNENRIKFYPETNQIDIISLSKLLGLPGGGLLQINGKYLTFNASIVDEEISKSIWSSEIIENFYPKFLKIHMNDFETLHPELNKWLLINDLSKAIEEENTIRRENLIKIIDSELSSIWPEWMIKAYKDGAAPGIVPILKNQPKNTLLEVCKYFMKTFGVETSIYHFNFSGDPIEPKYEIILAFPIHGMLKDKLAGFIEIMTNFIKK